MNTVVKTIDKVIENGEVAVLISHGYGAGWSTWSSNDEQMLYDPYIVNAVRKGYNFDRVEEYFKAKYPTRYDGGYEDLVVVWIPVGTKFVVTEYDGSENIQLESDIAWRVA